MADDDAAYMLASWAKPFSLLLLDICTSGRRKLTTDVRCLAGEIGTRLRTVCPYIESLPRYWIESDVNELCIKLLKQLATISMWPEKMQLLPGPVVPQCLGVLGRADPPSMKRPIRKYFSDHGNKKDIGDFLESCIQLYEKLAPAGAEESNGPPPNSGSVFESDYSKHNHELFDVLQKHCECRVKLRITPEDNTVWHPTRLYLEGNTRCASFGILVSSLDMSCWQELRLSVSPSDSEATTDLDMLKHGHICSLVEQRLYARILFEFKPGYGLYQLPRSEAPELILAAGQGQSLASILQHYHLTPRDKVLLSYSVARAYWQFYDSELMRRKWSSDTIWFMPTFNDDHKEELPLQAFVSFPFDAPDDPVEYYIDGPELSLNHYCPRAFALGVLLLEIGRASPFTTPVEEKLSSQVNLDHIIASNLLKKLRNTKWDGFSNMKYFVDAVEYCLDGKNFTESTTDSTCGTSKKQQDISERRANIYNKVVRPLEWLAVKGFNSNSQGTTYISKITNATVPTAQDPPPVHETPIGPRMGAFNSGSAGSRNWINDLVGISEHIDSIRSKLKMTSPIRVAILDTGINCDMPYYNHNEYGQNRIDQIECFHDLVQPGHCSKKDDFGHGSLMARLVAESTPFELTPFTKIMVVRVAKNTRDLAKCQDNIAEAIRWAGRQGADIISMSFGFQREHREISEAIHEVASYKRGVIFLASAGNSANEAEAFPARHPDVIPIYATNRHGTFLEFNSQRPTNGIDILGTYGDGIPSEITAEFDREYRGACQPGSSVATAVAASMAAMMLAYIATLPKLFSSPSNSKTVQRTLQGAHDSRGMEALFRKMAPRSFDGRLFINPVHFWRENNTDEARFHDICSCLGKVQRYL
ncbi:hypothetical protein CDV31_007861 [Fusarium ambrosium]|uniref:Uncharacterized protein n=1 Tax=Fusarium ambrosium TaxID=131363 RepID=A0A428U4A3_9HYPO|nr:hypothetical protein CDV31_007861 [Fusarium ambrosium]